MATAIPGSAATRSAESTPSRCALRRAPPPTQAWYATDSWAICRNVAEGGQSERVVVVPVGDDDGC